ncbi:MAG: hypothetical protein EA352_06830 [Gemmatimonadales bacterium]|nr:MAG: hypothetical protein EA352_06830 [Gemmatimonadales bacterium]
MSGDPRARRDAPRELVIASAGSGKTFRLSTHILTLLDGEADPESILASTFTRKAAGEILERVLLRLARVASGRPDEEMEGLSPARARELLVRLVDRMHQLAIGTLDSFFQRVARSFGMELGLPPEWQLADPSVDQRLQSRAVSRLLAGMDRGELATLLRLLEGGKDTARVHSLLLDRMGQLHSVYRDLVPGSGIEAWGFAEPHAGGRPTVAQREAVARAVDQARDLPLTRAGTPNGHWTRARDAAAQRLRDGDFRGFVEGGLGSALLGDGEYRKKPIEGDLAAAVEAGLELARRELGTLHHQRARALGLLLPRWDRILRELRAAEGLYTFDDVTRLVAGQPVGADSEAPITLPADRLRELQYRLDGEIRHLLLDEFQDTSVQQWQALRPLVEEVAAGYAGERALVVVGDPKQSIYGWRGGEPRLLEALEDGIGLPPVPLHESWRSTPAVLDFVNRVFGALPQLPALLQETSDTAPLSEATHLWLQRFRDHAPARPDAVPPGHVRVSTGPEGDRRNESVRTGVLGAAARRAAELREEAPHLDVGILVRNNRSVAHLVTTLARMGVEASGEGGVPVTDAPAVAAVLEALRLADHPDDRVAAYLVHHSPVRGLLKEAGGTPGLRRRLLEEGYGPVLSRWVRTLVGHPDTLPTARDRERLEQLTELAWRHDEAPVSLRPSEFVRWVATERMESPSAARVRVMTIHQSKGLEFDIVLLPDLDQSLTSSGGELVHPWRDRPDGPVVRVWPGIPRKQEALFPQAAQAVGATQGAQFRDGLSAVYVALTRARTGVELFLMPEKLSDGTLTGSALVRHALGLGNGALEPESLLHAEGTLESAPAPRRPRTVPVVPASPRPLPLESVSPDRRRRLLPRHTPSSLEGDGLRRLDWILSGSDSAARARSEGTLIHAWMEELGWIHPSGGVEEALPGADRLRAIARRVAPELREVDELLAAVQGWLAAPRVSAALAPRSGVEIRTEEPFLVRLDGALVRGIVDRLEVGGDRPRILDWKTDRVPPDDAEALAQRVAHYRPQVEAYRRAVARLEGCAPEEVDASLVFLRAGEVVELGAGRE